MNISDLQAFVAVARSASFSQAAERLHLTQPAVSKRVAALENELKTRLFDRLGRRVALTEAGRALLSHALRILGEVEDSRRALARLAGTVSGPLHLATSHHIGLHRLPPVLRRFTREHPEVTLNLRFYDSETACRAVMQGELELAVITLPPDAPEDLLTETIWHDALSLVTAPDHALCAVTPLEPALLAPYPAILPAHGTYTRALIERCLARSGLAPQVMLDTNYLETIKMLVSVGLAWSILPRTLLDDSLRAHSIAGWRISRDLGIVRHPRRTVSNAAAAFIEACRADVKQ
ncbi:MAG TPA: LysR family transcriptional regulator [Gammaproteobacteria bacterium]|nr:LysR family transcriptional regulator [Gammaproteobacteria bacterium]